MTIIKGAIFADSNEKNIEVMYGDKYIIEKRYSQKLQAHWFQNNRGIIVIATDGESPLESYVYILTPKVPHETTV